MPKRIRSTQDQNVAAFRVMQAATEDHAEPTPEVTKPAKKKRKNAAAVALGRKGGKIGGKRRAENLTPEQRAEAARRAARARWDTEEKR